MQQEIAQFLLYSPPVLIGNSLGKFIGLLNGHVTKALDRLFLIPGTFFPKFIHNRHQSQKRFT